MGFRRGQRVAFRGRTGTVKSTRPGGMVDVQFDDRRTGERRPAQDLRPVRSNPDSLSQEEAAELPEKEWLVWAKDLYTERLRKLEGRERALRENAERQREIHKAKEKFIADHGLTKFEEVSMAWKDVDYAPRSPEEVYQTKVHDAEGSAAKIKGAITALKRAIGELSTGTYPKTRFSSAKARKLRKTILAVPVVPVPRRELRPAKLEQEQKAEIKRAESIDKEGALRDAARRIRGTSLGQEVASQKALFRIVQDRPRSSPSGLTECGNPIDGKAYVLVVDATRSTVSFWVKFRDLGRGIELEEGERSLGINLPELYDMEFWQKGQKKLPDGRVLEAVDIPTRIVEVEPSPRGASGRGWKGRWTAPLPPGAMFVDIVSRPVQEARQRKEQTMAGKGHGRQRVRRKVGTPTTLHSSRNIPPAPYYGESAHSNEIDNPVIIQLNDGRIKAFRVKDTGQPIPTRLQEQFSPFPRWTPKGENPFFSWVPEKAGEFQRILTEGDPDAGQVPCVDPEEAEQIKIARRDVRRLKQDFGLIRRWGEFLSSDKLITRPQWASEQLKNAGRAIRDIYMIARNIQYKDPETGKPKLGYTMLHKLWAQENDLLVQLVRYPLHAARTRKRGGIAFLYLQKGWRGRTEVKAISPSEAMRVFVQAAKGEALGPADQEIAKFLATIVRAPNLSKGLLTYWESTLPDEAPLPKVQIHGRDPVHWSKVSKEVSQLPTPESKEIISLLMSRYIPIAFEHAEPFYKGDLRDAMKVIVDLAVEHPDEKLTPDAASSLFWYYALLLSLLEYGGPLSKKEERGWTPYTASEKKALTTIEGYTYRDSGGRAYASSEVEQRNGSLFVSGTETRVEAEMPTTVQTKEGPVHRSRDLTPTEKKELDSAYRKMSKVRKRREVAKVASVNVADAIERDILPSILAIAGGSTIGQASAGGSPWRAYKTFNPLVFKVTQEYFRDRSKWIEWSENPRIDREAQLIGYYGSLLRIIQMAEVKLVQEGNPPKDWNDISLVLISMLRPIPEVISPIWTNISPSWWSPERTAASLMAFLEDPPAYVQAVKREALPGFLKVGDATRGAKHIQAIEAVRAEHTEKLGKDYSNLPHRETLKKLRDLAEKRGLKTSGTVDHLMKRLSVHAPLPSKIIEETDFYVRRGHSDREVEHFRSGTFHGDPAYPPDSVASKMGERENTRLVLLSALNKYIDNLR